MFDVFYQGPKPNLFAFEKPAESLADAARQSRTKYYWFIYGLNDYSNFDFDYVPVPWQSEYIHTWPNQWQPDGEVYLAKRTNSGQPHYHEQIVRRLGVKQYWHIPDYIDLASVDTTWCPDPLEPAYIYHFPSQHQSCSGVTYTIPGATEVKLVDAFVVKALPNPARFGHNIAVTEFDYTWHPNVLDPAYTYVFGNQWNPATLETTVVYHVDGATEIKYMEPIAIAAPDMTNWELLDDIAEFDYSWRPNPTEPAYIYIFGNQWLTPEQRPALKYVVPGSTEIKYMDMPKATRTSKPELFVTHYDCEFDYSWEPDPGSPAYNYVFGNQWYPGEQMPTVEYRMLGATETKFVDVPAQLLPTTLNWRTLVDCEFDYSWCPDPGDPPYIYVFGNQHWPAIKMPTVEYHVPGAAERKFLDYPATKLLPNLDAWHVPEEIDVANIDYSWCPDPGEPAYIYHFGTDYQQSIGLTYTVPGATELKFWGDIPRVKREKTAVKALEIFFIDRNNAKSQVRYERLQAQYENVVKVRYANSMFETIQRCVTRAQGNKFWVVSSEYNYDKFDFYWHAEPWQSYMTHVFPSQHNKWSDTFLINKWEFERHAKWANGLEQFPNLNFVQDQMVDKPEATADIYYVDHGNPESDDNYNYLKVAIGEAIRTRFVGEYLDVLKRIVNTAETEYVWVVSSLCRYNYFDFTWEPEPWQREMIHCFASGSQKRGDTFYIHVESFKQQMVELELLDWFNVINYVENISVDRYLAPVHVYTGDDLITEIKNYDFKTPYVTFTNQPDLTLAAVNCLWSAKDRTVVRSTRSGATCKVPRDIKQHLKTQIYDYPYLDKYHFVNEYYNGKTFPGIDIVYISNGEPDEEKWYDTLCYRANLMSQDIAWIRGVNGRTAAYQAAARASTTPWFFAVFAKIEVDYNFPWQDWMPDYWQEPKHYIFNARNPVNGLEYGHMSVIAYNKNLVLSHNTPGIDFTLSQPHESVPILSGTAHFNQDPWMTWRTAFREVIKLKHFDATTPTVENTHRLETWCTQAQGQYAEYCLQGAQDATKYYNEVNGDYELLKLSFEWAWLRERFERK